MNKKLFWGELPKNNILIAFIIVLIEFPCIYVAARIVLSIGGVFGFNLLGDSDREFEPYFYIALVGFLFHFITYVFFRFAVKQKIHITILTALSIAFAICVPFMAYEFLHTVFFKFATLFGYVFLYQAILFCAFAVTISMLDRRIGSMSWLKTLISFAMAIAVGTLVSWCIWILLMKLYFYLH